MTTIYKEELKKYALNYIKRYATSKKNLYQVLQRKVYKIGEKDKEKNKKIILDIINILEEKNIINDEEFANSKAYNYMNRGKSIRSIKFNLLKKGVDKETANNAIKKLEDSIPDLEIKSAENFARKKKLGVFGNFGNKQKDLAKMANAGFNYSLSLKILGYD